MEDVEVVGFGCHPKTVSTSNADSPSLAAEIVTICLFTLWFDSKESVHAILSAN